MKLRCFVLGAVIEVAKQNNRSLYLQGVYDIFNYQNVLFNHRNMSNYFKIVSKHFHSWTYRVTIIILGLLETTFGRLASTCWPLSPYKPTHITSQPNCSLFLQRDPNMLEDIFALEFSWRRLNPFWHSVPRNVENAHYVSLQWQNNSWPYLLMES